MAKKPAAKSAKAEPKAKKAAAPKAEPKAKKAVAPKAEKAPKAAKAVKEAPEADVEVADDAAPVEKPAKAPKAPKPPKPKSAKALAAEKAIADENKKWADLKDKHASEKAAPYSMSSVYESNKPLQHKVLGWGYIVSVQNDRLEVLFETGTKLLISNYKR